MSLQYKKDEEFFKLDDKEYSFISMGSGNLENTIMSSDKNTYFVNDVLEYVDKMQVKVDGVWKDVESVYEIVNGEKVYQYPIP
jgi:hypothetical protein